MKFHRNPSNGSQADACEQTDRHDEASMHFCEYLKNDTHLGECSVVTIKYIYFVDKWLRSVAMHTI